MVSFANPWGLLALATVPAIVAIHLYRRRFPQMAVAATFLWGGQTEVRDAGRTRDRLPLTATLLLEVLAATVLALLLAQPRLGGTGRVPHLVVVLDDSASMAAARADGASVRDAAVAEVERRVADLGRRTVVTLVTTGRRPALLAGPAARWDRAKERLATWSPRATAHDPTPAWDLAAQLGGDEGRLVYLTDRVPEGAAAVPRGMEVSSLGHPAGNVALTAARWRLDPDTGRGTIALRVDRFGGPGDPVRITGTAAGRAVFEREVAIDGAGSAPVAFEAPGGLERLTIEASSPEDALSIDSTLTLIEPRRRGVKVAMTLTEEHAAAGPLRRVLERLPAVEFATRDEADLVITPAGTLPEADPDLWWLGVGPLDPGDAARMESVDVGGPYVIDKRDPLTDGLALGGVAWGGVQETRIAASPLVSAGKYVLLSRLDGTPTKAVLLNIDFARSNLAESPDWPIFVANLVNAVRDDRPGLRRWNYRSGETIAMRLPPEAEGRAGALTLTGPDGERPVARTRVLEVATPATPGAYAIRDGDRVLAEFAVNFQDDEESDLTTRRSGAREPVEAPEARGVSPDTVYSWPVLAALACVIGFVVGDWYVLRPPLH